MYVFVCMTNVDMCVSTQRRLEEKFKQRLLKKERASKAPFQPWSMDEAIEELKDTDGFLDFNTQFPDSRPLYALPKG